MMVVLRDAYREDFILLWRAERIVQLDFRFDAVDRTLVHSPTCPFFVEQLTGIGVEDYTMVEVVVGLSFSLPCLFRELGDLMGFPRPSRTSTVSMRVRAHDGPMLIRLHRAMQRNA
jgi:hypothetical protein